MDLYFSIFLGRPLLGASSLPRPQESELDYIACPCTDVLPSLFELNSLTQLFLSSEEPEKILSSIDMYSKSLHADSEK